MPRIIPTLLSSVIVLAAAACADASRTVTSPASKAASFDVGGTPNLEAGNNPDRHYFELYPGNPARGNPGGGGGGGGGTGIFYHGGPVLLNGTNVAAVYWAAAKIYNYGPTAGTTGPGSADTSLVGFFLNHLGGSAYFNINTTYTNGSGAPIANSVNYTQYWANNTNVPSNGQVVSDAQIVAMLQSGFNGGQLTYDPSTLYHVFTAGTVNLGGGFGTQYCAYHWYGTVTIGGTARTVLYSAAPYDYAYPTACAALSGGSPNGDFAADAEVNTIAHETEETTTDPLGTAWFDRRGYENADKCAWTFGTTYISNGATANMNIGGKDFLIQRNWVNAGHGGCLQSWTTP